MKNRTLLKKWFRPAVAGLLAGVLVIGMTGCGTGSGSSDTESGTSEQGSAEGSTAAEEETDGSLTTIRVAAMTGNTDHWLVLLGQELGFFEEQGLEVEISEFAAGINTVDALVTGQADVGFVADYAIVNRLGNTSDNADLKLIARFCTSGSETWFYADPDVMTDISEIEGKTIVTVTGTIYDYWNSYMLDLYDIPEDSVEIAAVDSGSLGFALISAGDAAGMWGFGTTKSKLEEAGMVPILNLNEIGLSTDSYYVTTDSILEDSPQLLTAYLTAIAATEAWVTENEEEAAGIIADLLNLDTDTALANIQSVDLGLDFSEETLDHLYDIKNWALENGSFDTDYEVEDFLSLELLRELYPDEVEVD